MNPLLVAIRVVYIRSVLSILWVKLLALNIISLLVFCLNSSLGYASTFHPCVLTVHTHAELCHTRPVNLSIWLIKEYHFWVWFVHGNFCIYIFIYSCSLVTAFRYCQLYLVLVFLLPPCIYRRKKINLNEN